MKMLWAVKIGNEDWAEEIITVFEERIPDAMDWAKENGFDRLRVAEYYDGEKPDFAKTVNVWGII